MKTPTTSEFEEFLKLDGWEPIRDSKHGHYEKRLADGTVLGTHVSFGKKGMSKDLFKDILKYQLAVTEEQFWATIRAKKSQRTTTVVAPAKEDRFTLALRQELIRKLHYTDAQMIGMTGTKAKQLLSDFYQKGKPR